MDKWTRWAESILIKEKNRDIQQQLEFDKFDIMEKERKEKIERRKHAPKSRKRSYNKGRTKYQIVEGSKRQRVFNFLHEHPSMTIECLYQLFDSSTFMNRQVLQNYKSTFLKINKINKSNNFKPYTYKDYEADQIKKLNEINSLYDLIA